MRRLAALLLLLGLVGWTATAAGNTGHRFPTCKAFSTTKVSHVVGVGKLYLVSTLARGRNCTYYGVSKSGQQSSRRPACLTRRSSTTRR